MMKRLFFCGLLWCIGLQATAQAAADIRDNLFLFDGENGEEKAAKNLFCRAEASRNTVFTGQPVVVTLKLYSALQSYSVVEKTPGFNGFSTYDISTGREPVDEVVNGRPYRSHIIRKLQLYPLEAGVFTLEPVQVTNTITYRRINGRKSISLDEMLSGDGGPAYTEERVTYHAQTSPLTITVKPQPEAGKPAAFNGATGKFLLEAACSSAEADQFGAVKVSFTLSGSGNFKMINSLPVSWPAGVDAFEPEITEAIDENLVPFAGKKVFTYTLSPSVEGPLTIPAVPFYYFDPAKGGYQVSSSDSIRIVVKKAAAPVKEAGTRNPNAAGSNTSSNVLWYAGGGAALCLGLLLILVMRKRRAAPPPPAPVAEPEPLERTPFQSSTTLLMLGETKQFYAALRRELTMEAALKLNLPADATARDVEQALGVHQAAPEFGRFIGSLDAALYASGTNQQTPEECLDFARQLLASVRV